jgi:hypothetical protein
VIQASVRDSVQVGNGYLSLNKYEYRRNIPSEQVRTLVFSTTHPMTDNRARVPPRWSATPLNQSFFSTTLVLVL